MCMYVSEICAEGFFVTFPWWLKNVKSRSKIALFSDERHFEIWFPKGKTIMFFWNELSKLHKERPNLHVATTFSLKQGKTRTSHGPIPHPLNYAAFIVAKMHIFAVFKWKPWVILTSLKDWSFPTLTMPTLFFLACARLMILLIYNVCRTRQHCKLWLADATSPLPTCWGNYIGSLLDK